MRASQHSSLDDERVPALMIDARVRCGWQTIVLDRANGTVRMPAGVRLDLGATAKAWAADRAAAAAFSVSGCGALVGIGGDIATCGTAPDAGWKIRVTDDHRSDCAVPGRRSRSTPAGLPLPAPPFGAGVRTATPCTTSSTRAAVRPCARAGGP